MRCTVADKNTFPHDGEVRESVVNDAEIPEINRQTSNFATVFRSHPVFSHEETYGSVTHRF